MCTILSEEKRANRYICFNITNIVFMKRIALLVLALSSVLFFNCTKEEQTPALDIQNVTNGTLTSSGGMGSITVTGVSDGIDATSSTPEWLRVQVHKNIVLFNVLSHTGNQPRSGEITISAEKCTPVTVTITQSAFTGLQVMVRSVELTNDKREQVVEIISSGEYNVKITDDPNNVFNFRKVEEGVVFYTSRAQGNNTISARATIIPADETAEPVDISLTIPQKDLYDYILGTWNVDATDGDLASVTFTARVRPDTYNMYFNIDGLQDYPVLAQFIDGQVTIASGQKLGKDSQKFYSLHFNGTIDGAGWYIFNSPGQVAWGAVPVFDEKNGKISLKFKDNGQGLSHEAKLLAIWGCAMDYFNFGAGNAIVGTNTLELSKTYSE